MKGKFSKKRFFISLSAFLTTTLASGVITYALLPKQAKAATVHESSGWGTDDEIRGGVAPVELTGSQLLVQKMMDQMSKGLDFNEINIKVEIPQKREGQEDIIHTIEIRDADLKLVIGEESSVSLSASLPIVYNDTAAITINADYIDDNLYLSILDNYHETSTFDVRYQIDLSKKYEFVEEDGSSYNKVISEWNDISEHLGDLIAEYGMISLGDSFDPSAMIDTEMFANLDLNSILDALNGMEETKTDKGSIFRLDLPLGEDFILPIAIGSDSEYNLRSVELPAKDSGKEFLEIPAIEGLKVAVNVDSVRNDELHLVRPAGEFRKISDSLGLLDSIYPLVVSPRFELSFEGDLTHEIAEGESESIHLEMDGAADFKSAAENSWHSAEPDAVYLNADLSLREGNELKAGQSLGLGYTDGTAYLSMNDVLKLRMPRLTLDDFVARLKHDVGNGNNESKLSMEQLEKVLGLFKNMGLNRTIQAIRDSVNGIKNSALVNDIKDGKYQSILPVLESIQTTKDTMSIVLDLSPIGVFGTVSLVFDGRSSYDLAKVEISNLQFASFAFSGTLRVNGVGVEEEIVDPSFATTDLEQYHSLYRIPDIYDQILGFIDTRAASISIQGSMLSTENGISGVGVHFAGDFDMDVGQRIGTGDITFTDCKLNKAKTALKKQDYNISIDVVHQLNEEGAIIADQSMMYFALDSAVNTALNGESWHKNMQGNTKGNRFRGYFSVQSLNDIIGVAGKFLSGEDARFSKYFDWITASLGASAITDITNNKFGGLVTLRVLTDIQYGDDYAELHLNPELLGMEGDPVVTIHYDSHNQLKSLTINMVMSDGKALDLTVSLKDSYHPVAENWRVNNFKNGARDVSNFINFSTIELLLEYGLGSAMLGVEEEGASILTDSTYRLTLSTDLSLGILPLPVHIYLDIFIYVNGSTVKVWGNFVVPGLLGIKGFSYKTTTTTFAYSTTGNGPIHEEFGETHDTGDLYIHSHHYVGGFAGIGTKERNDYWKVRGGSFIKNIGEWLLIAFMGNDGTVLEDSSSSATADKQIYIEDVISSYSFSGSDGNSPIWDVKVDLDALVEGIFTGDENEIGAKIYGVGSENGDVDTRTLSKVDLTVNIHFIFSIKLTGTIYLDNVNQTTGAYTECWTRVYGKNLESGSAYTTSAAARWSSLISKVSSSTSGYSVSPK